MKSDMLEIILTEEKEDRLNALLKNKPATTFKLIRKLYSTDDKLRNQAIKAFSAVANILNETKLNDIVQRLMWLLNEESGNYCPYAAQALVEIARTKPQSVQDHLPQLEYYANCESEVLRRESSNAVREIKIILNLTDS